MFRSHDFVFRSLQNEQIEDGCMSKSSDWKLSLHVIGHRRLKQLEEHMLSGKEA